MTQNGHGPTQRSAETGLGDPKGESHRSMVSDSEFLCFRQESIDLSQPDLLRFDEALSVVKSSSFDRPIVPQRRISSPKKRWMTSAARDRTQPSSRPIDHTSSSKSAKPVIHTGESGFQSNDANKRSASKIRHTLFLRQLQYNLRNNTAIDSQ